MLPLPFSRPKSLLTALVFLATLNACSDKNNEAATPAAPATVTIARPNLYPEGLAYDALNNRFLVSSFTGGTLGQVKDDGTYTAFADDSQLISSTGVFVDAPRNRVLVTVTDIGLSSRSAPATQGKLAALVSFDRSTGRRLAYTDLGSLRPGAPGHFANDVAVDAQGNAYVTDSFGSAIYKVDPQGTASVFLESSRFNQAAGSFGLNGIAVHPDGYLLVGKYDDGTLYKVPLANPSSFTKITTSQAFASADGFSLLDNNTLAVAANGTTNAVFRLRTTDNWATATLAGTFATGDNFPSDLTRRDGDLYVLYTHLGLLLGGKPAAPAYSIQRVSF